MNRRSFLKNAMGLSAVGLTSSFSFMNSAIADEMMVKGPAIEDKALVKVSDRLYTFFAPIEEPTPENMGFFSNPAFVVTSEGVVVFDTGSSVQIGEMILRQIKTVTDKPVIKVVNSHMHGDHWLGNHAFVEAYPNVEIYAHPYTTEQLKNGEDKFWLNLMARSTDNATYGTVITMANKEMNGGEVWKLGDTTLKFHFLGQCHTKGDLMMEVVEDNIVCVGDAIMDTRISNMAGGNFKNTIAAMQQLQEKFPGATFVPGHGKHGTELAKNYETLYQLIYDYAYKAMDEGMEAYEVKEELMADSALDPYRNWVGIEGSAGELGKFLSLCKAEIELAEFG